MALVRKLVVISLNNNILFKSQHIEGKLNQLADDHIVSLKQSAPWAAYDFSDGCPARELITGAVALLKRSMTEGTWNNYRRSLVILKPHM